MSWDKTKDELRDEFSRQVNKRKPTKQWCKGKVGREHDVELVVNHNYTGRMRGCGWREIIRWFRGERHHWRWHYFCCHAYQCKNCGKYTEFPLRNLAECPDYVERPHQPAD